MVLLKSRAVPPPSRIKPGSIVTPGERIGSVRALRAGPGTHVRGRHVHASLVGRLRLDEDRRDDGSRVATVVPPAKKEEEGRRDNGRSYVDAGVVVVGRIVRVTAAAATVEIVAGGDGVGALRETCGGAVRREDAREVASDETDLFACFRSGDVVLARVSDSSVLGATDGRRYDLSTAEDGLGVVRATSSTSGRTMVPVSRDETECPVTGLREPRKCAVAVPAADGDDDDDDDDA